MNTNETLPMVSSVSATPEPAASAMSIWTSKTEGDLRPVTRDDLVEMGKGEALKLATDEIWRSLNTLFLPDQIVELRALDVTTPEKRMSHIDSGYYDVDHHDLLIERALWLQRSAQAKGVYVTLQDLRPALLARRANRSAPAKETTADHDVVRYRWLPVDLDMHPSIRPSGVSSSPEQWTQIHAAAARLSAVLTELGWPQPVYADSGNGAHFLWRVDLLPSDAGLVSRVLNALHARTKEMDPDVDVDVKNYNPARIWKLYGTLACKGDHMPFAPHRLSRIVEAPQNPTVLTVEQLQDVCARWVRAETPVKLYKPASPAAPTIKSPTGGSWSIEGWAAKVGLELPEPQTFHSHTGPGQKWNLKPCPCNRKCADGAAIQQAGDGTVSFRCHHNNCNTRSWGDLRTLLGDPKRSYPQEQTATKTPLPRTAVSSKPSEDQAPADKVGQWEAALENWLEIFRKEGAESKVTMENFAVLITPLMAAWEQLPASVRRPEAIFARLPKMGTGVLMTWARRVERLFEVTSLRIREPKLFRTDDDRAATYLRSVAAEDNRVSAELGALDEPWRVALNWVTRAPQNERSERIEVFLHVLRQTSRWFTISMADEICELAVAADLDEDTVLKTFPADIFPKEQKPLNKNKKNASSNKKPKKEVAIAKEAVRVLDVFPDAPVFGELVIPEPYTIRDGAIGQIIKKIHMDGTTEETFEVHLARPLLIANCRMDQEGYAWLTLVWSRLDDWQTIIVERSSVCDRAKIIGALSLYGIPVDSTNAMNAIKWLMHFEERNLESLPALCVSNRLGWKRGGFLLGDSWIDADGEHLTDACSAVPQKNAWAFAYTGATDQADIKAFNAREGSLQGWKDVVSKIIHLPKVLIALYASLAAPLVSLIGERTPIIDWSGPAGTGKTSTLRLAASVWGNPSEYKGHIISGWNTTAAAIERRAGLLGHLPIILNDSNKAPDGLQGKLIYELTEGVGKQRGNRTGGRQMLSSWSTIILSTGEARLLDYAKSGDAGAAHRVLSLHGSPWDSNQKGDQVRQLRDGLKQHHGHAGRLFILWLNTRLATSLQDWKGRLRALRSKFEALINSNVAAERLCEDLTLILLAAELAHEALDLPWPVELAHSMANHILLQVIDSTTQIAAHEKAFCALWEWCWSNRDAFWGRRRTDSPPSMGWAGRWDNQEKWEEIFVVPSVADRILRDLGFQPLSMRKEWVDADFIRRGEGRNLLPAVRIDGLRLRCLALKREAVMKLCSINTETPDA